MSVGCPTLKVSIIYRAICRINIHCLAIHILLAYCRGFSKKRCCMLITTKAIVLNNIPYSDSKRIITLFSNQQGLISAIIRISGKSYGKMSLLEPFSLVEIVVKKGSGSFFYVNDILPHKIFATIPFDTQKRVITLFMAEVVYRTVRDHYQDTMLYNFLEDSIVALDTLKGDMLKFSLVFLLEYGRRLGIYPNIETYSDNSFFDMQDGVFDLKMPPHKLFVAPDDSRILLDLLNMDYISVMEQDYSKEQINSFFNLIIQFLELHLPDFRHIKSLDILRQII